MGCMPPGSTAPPLHRVQTEGSAMSALVAFFLPMQVMCAGATGPRHGRRGQSTPRERTASPNRASNDAVLALVAAS